jgi:hypothetical protein
MYVYIYIYSILLNKIHFNLVCVCVCMYVCVYIYIYIQHIIEQDLFQFSVCVCVRALPDTCREVSRLSYNRFLPNASQFRQNRMVRVCIHNSACP